MRLTDDRGNSIGDIKFIKLSETGKVEEIWGVCKAKDFRRAVNQKLKAS